MQEGISGKIAHFFIKSKLTILLMVALMIIGVYSSFLIPREEEPQINVPMADVLIGYPGASPQEVESRVVKPLEKILSNIKGCRAFVCKIIRRIGQTRKHVPARGLQTRGKNPIYRRCTDAGHHTLEQNLKRF
jgi:hypothetical protein